MESVVVKETWFFRDREPFRALAGLVQREWLPAHPNGHLRVLSLPCSTGEEPYSIAMALLDAGLPAGRFQVDAFDLRPNAIAHAQRAEYGRNSFRGKDLAFRASHFQPTAKGHSLNLSVRQQVHFETGNLLDESCLAQVGVYDFIFCRNLLIYFDQATRQRALRKLHRLLTPTGVLFVGSAEVNIATHGEFVSAHLPLSFACRRVAKESVPIKARPRPVTALAENPPDKNITTTLMGLPPPADDLGQARQFADAGNLAAAAGICENFLRRRGAAAEAYYILGLVRDAAGADSEAGEFYRKALYLEPNHYETLTQWAALSQKNGDGAHARILTERAERIRKSDLEAP